MLQGVSTVYASVIFEYNVSGTINVSYALYIGVFFFVYFLF